MIELYLIGIGMGNPDHLTGSARAALQGADLIMIPEKEAFKSDLAIIRQKICKKILSPLPNIVMFKLPERLHSEAEYFKKVELWHDKIAVKWQSIIKQHLPKGGRAALMIWGDPTLYDSSLRIADRLKLQLKELKINTIPGLTSIQLLTAAYNIPLNSIGKPVTLSTGRQLRDKGWPEGCETLVVMLDGDTSFDQLEGELYEIWWGAFLGMPNELLISGRLDHCCEKIKSTRKLAKSDHGWIMDIYLLRIRNSQNS